MLMVSGEERSITQISENFDITRQAVTKHIEALEDANLIKIRSNGRERYCSGSVKGFKTLIDWMSFYEEIADRRVREKEAFAALNN